LDRLGIELLCIFGMPPPAFVELAADLGCQHISIGLVPMPDNPHGYPKWSLRDDPVLRREMLATLRDRRVNIALGEGYLFRPGLDIRDQAADLGLMAELGVKCANAVSIDPDMSRNIDQYAAFAELAAAQGMAASIEFMPGLPIGNLAAAVQVVRQVNQAHLRLLIDCMHLMRSGGSAADLAALGPAMIGHIQICDAPLQAPMSNYAMEARCERMIPGTGELPLHDILCALPRDVVASLEVPMLAKALAGIGPRERLQPCVTAARQILAHVI
jgi:sugar phosphate isomerase/epimerase